MTETQLEREVLMHLENAACIGRTPQDYSDYCKRLARGLMVAINKYKETEKVIETVEE
jgi:hypothetical protein